MTSSSAYGFVCVYVCVMCMRSTCVYGYFVVPSCLCECVLVRRISASHTNAEMSVEKRPPGAAGC